VRAIDTFVFSATMDPAKMESGFRLWLDHAVKVGLEAWRRSL